MPFRDLREFVVLLEARGQLKRITVPVDPRLEIAAITDHVTKRGGPALLFENPVGARMPLLINAFGTEERMAWGLGINKLDELGAKLEKLLSLVQGGPPAGLMDKLKALNDLKSLADIGPKVVRMGVCQEVVITDNPSFDLLPVLQCWPRDGGRYITLTGVYSKDPRTGKRNVGMYRVQIYDNDTAGMHWQIHKDGAEQQRHAQAMHQRMDVAIALGGDPPVIYVASAPAPPNMDELLLAGLIRGAPVDLVQCKTVDVQVPANAEIVLEGYVDPNEKRVEGPFGDHTGYYSLAEPYPVFHLTAITHRQNPIYPTIIVGKPIQEDAFLGKATERMFLPLVKTMLPELVDMNMPYEGVFHNLLIVSIRKRYPGHAKKVMAAIWGLGMLSLSKHVIVVDADVNVHNIREVTWRVTNNIDARRDVVIVDGPVDALDHASSVPLYGGKMGLDATIKLPQEGYTREWPPDIQIAEETRQLIARRWKEYGL